MAYTTTRPLSSVFTPPAYCNTQWTYEGEYYNSIPNGLLIQNALEGYPGTDCFPESFKGFGRAPSVTQVYSPGACPVGYATAGNTYNGATTTAICCPSYFSYMMTYSSINHYSRSAIFYGCISQYRRDAGATKVLGRADGTNLERVYVTGPLTMWAQPISVAFREVDMTFFTTSTSSQPSTISSPSIATAAASASTSKLAPSTAESSNASGQQSTASPSPATLNGSTEQGLSTASIAGVAIGGAAVVGILIGLAIIFRRRKKRLHGSNDLTVVPVAGDDAWREETDSKPQTYVHWESAELDAGRLHKDTAHEMASQQMKEKPLKQNLEPAELG